MQEPNRAKTAEAADTSGFLEVAGMQLEYRRLAGGRRRSPTLVLLHEGLGCVALWKDFPERLAATTGLPVFLWSRAGFGRSEPITLPRPLDYLERESELVADVLQAAGLREVVLVGHSDGGTIALLHAAGRRSDGLHGLVTMAAHVFVEDVTIAGIEQVRRTWEEGSLRARLARWHGENVACAFHGWCDTWLAPGFRSWNIEASLPAVRVPVLAMQGIDDEYGTPAQVDAIVRQVSGPAEALLLPGVGHAPHVDAPDAVIAAVGRFLADPPGD